MQIDSLILDSTSPRSVSNGSHCVSLHAAVATSDTCDLMHTMKNNYNHVVQVTCSKMGNTKSDFLYLTTYSIFVACCTLICGKSSPMLLHQTHERPTDNSGTRAACWHPLILGQSHWYEVNKHWQKKHILYNVNNVGSLHHSHGAIPENSSDFFRKFK